MVFSIDKSEVRSSLVFCKNKRDKIRKKIYLSGRRDGSDWKGFLTKVSMSINYMQKFIDDSDGFFKKSRSTDGFVYIVHDKKNEWIKIGWTSNPLTRLATICSSFLSKKDEIDVFIVRGSRDLEQLLQGIFMEHNLFYGKRWTCGVERYHPHPSIINFAKKNMHDFGRAFVVFNKQIYKTI